MTELMIQSLIDLYKFNIKIAHKGINSFWKITFSLTIILTIAIIAFILLCTPTKYDPCRWDNSAVDVNLKNQITVTVIAVISITFALIGYRLDKLRDDLQKRNDKCKYIQELLSNQKDSKQKFSKTILSKQTDFDSNNQTELKKSSSKIETEETIDLDFTSDISTLNKAMEEDETIGAVLPLLNIVPKICYSIGIVMIVAILALRFTVTIIL